jgi:hypothetical protein
MRKPNTHGDRTRAYTTPEYAAWKSMRNRCFNTSNPAYPRYGGRGITVCERWNDYPTFLKDMGRKPSKSHSLDRIDNNKGYSPANCRWAGRKEQTQNRRSNKVVEFMGRRQSVAAWCDELGLVRNAVYLRLAAGVPVGEAFTRPVRERRSV